MRTALPGAAAARCSRGSGGGRCPPCRHEGTGLRAAGTVRACPRARVCEPRLGVQRRTREVRARAVPMGRACDGA